MIRFLLLITLCSLGFADYTTPAAFNNLLYSFYGKDTSIGSIYAKQTSENVTGPLLLFINSDLYIYDNDRKLIGHAILRDQPNSGSAEVTAVSHIGPSVSYILRLKEKGYSEWKQLAQSLKDNVDATQKENLAQPSWFSTLNAPSWSGHETATINMIDYGCRLASHYLDGILKDEPFTTETVNSQFLLSRTNEYPIPFNNVMVGTFMLAGMLAYYDLYQTIAALNLDWANSKIIIRTVAGGNFTGGLSARNNIYFKVLTVIGGEALEKNRIMIAPYAEVKSSLGQATLPQEDFDYYNTVWSDPYIRHIAVNDVFTNIKDIDAGEPNPIPGDYPYTKPDDILAFLERLKYSFGTPTQNLAGTVGFWLPGALAANQWNFSTIQLPGLEVGFPSGITAYPTAVPAKTS